MDSALELRNVSKRFGGVQALQDVDVTFEAGSVHVLLGENGAGKSTLVAVCSGAVHADTGQLLMGGKEFRFANPFEASQAGVSVVHQEPALAPQLTVLENIYLPELSTRKSLSRFRVAELEESAHALLNSLGISLNLDALVGSLAISSRQLVEIAKAAAMNPQVLILDEPNSALSPAETDRMMAMISRLRDHGHAVVLVSHRLDEVFQVGQAATVLRDGRVVWRGALSTITRKELIRYMAGKPGGMTDQAQKPAARSGSSAGGKPMLEVRGLSRNREYHDIDLTIARGEIVGLAGLVGAGRSELAMSLFGVTKPDRGKVLLDGKQVAFRSARDAIRSGIAMLPEDRHVQSLFGQMPVRWNIEVARRSVGIREHDSVSSLVQRFRIKAASIGAGVLTLSGGNQQKAVLARWVSVRPKVLILDEPTRGVDVNAKAEIYRLIHQFADDGMAILLISSELDEVMGLSDRVLVMRHGAVRCEFAAGADPADVIAQAFDEGGANAR